MSFTADWDETSPIDHTLNKLWPDEIRDFKIDVSDRLKNILYGFTSGETEEAFKKVPLKTGSAPAAVADYFHLYGKDVSAKVELFGRDEDGDEIQITTGGKLNAAALDATLANWATIMALIYPIGSIYMNASDGTNPATLLGFGTWALIGAGKIPICINSADADFDTLGETGGAKTATLTTTELPAHTHDVSASDATGGSGDKVALHHNASNTSTISGAAASAGSGAAFSIMNPYVVVAAWKRTA